MKMPRILFFIDSLAPTPEESAAALEIGAVAMRNRSLIADNDKPEQCDGVAGAIIPAPYQGFPVVKTLADAIELVRKKQRAENATAAVAVAKPKSRKGASPESPAPSGTEAGGENGGNSGAAAAAAAGWARNA